jgi:hypothetical protein
MSDGICSGCDDSGLLIKFINLVLLNLLKFYKKLDDDAKNTI